MAHKFIDEFPEIARVLTADGIGSCWQEDISSIRKKWIPPGERWITPASAPGMRFVRQPARVLSIGLGMKDGRVAWGDCLSVSFAGKSGRESAFSNDDAAVHFIKSKLRDELIKCQGKRLADVESFLRAEHPELPTSVWFGISQALVNAVSTINNVPAHLVLRDVLGTDAIVKKIPAKIELQGSCGSNWRDVVERMIIAGVKYLPQGQFENLEIELGNEGAKLFEYIDWLKERIGTLGPVSLKNGNRVITLDFHGALGLIFNNDVERIATYINTLESRCKPHGLHIESPLVMSTFDQQLSQLSALQVALRKRKSTALVIADEWANNLDQIEKLALAQAVGGIHIKMPDTGSILDSGRAVALCRKSELFCLLGGSCTETTTSTTLAVHLAAATAPDALLIKPGISFDEGFSLISTEFSRIQSCAS
jgi:methylaspartate ammonia-lyase